MSASPFLSIVIPLYNESEVFDRLIERLQKVLGSFDHTWEVVLVDDGSKDDTTLRMEKLATENPKFQSVFLSRNFGHQKALVAGLSHARGERIFIIDADLQDPPELLFDFMKEIDAGYDVVYGIRTKRKEGPLKRMAYNGFYRLLNAVSNHHIPKDSGDFGMITRRVANAMLHSREDSIFLRGMRSWVGFRQKGLVYERDERAAGAPKYSFKKLLHLASEGLFNFTTFPVKALISMGALFIGVSLIYFVITLVRKFAYGDVPQGFTALLFIIILFGGFQIFSLGILGEYIQRIFFQVKARPPFVVRKVIKDGHEE